MKKITMLALALAALAGCSKEYTGTTEKTVMKENAPQPEAVNALAQRTISFSGINWTVRDQAGPSGPHDNYWSGSTDNVWVDAQGHLHLKIRRDAATGRWYCSEVISQQSFGYGTYIWKIEGRVDQLDRNVVLGLFNYKSGDDGHHEIDIEFARWGNDAWHNFNYTVYPAYGSPSVSQTFELALNGTYSTYTFHRTGTSVSYVAYHGHGETYAFFPWSTPAGFPVSTESLPVHMNMWLFQHMAPANGQEVEVIIHSFEFRPL